MTPRPEWRDKTCQACGEPADGWIDVEDRGPDDKPGIHVRFRCAIVCTSCTEKMDADMWVSKAHWEALNPNTPYNQLQEI